MFGDICLEIDQKVRFLYLFGHQPISALVGNKLGLGHVLQYSLGFSKDVIIFRQSPIFQHYSSAGMDQFLAIQPAIEKFYLSHESIGDWVFVK